jgi:hypothetical protein
VTSAQIVLISEMLKFSKCTFLKEQIFVEEKKESLEYFEIFFNMKSSKLINYLADVC